MKHPYESLIHDAFENKHQYSPGHCPTELINAIQIILSEMNQGIIRIGSKKPSYFPL